MDAGVVDDDGWLGVVGSETKDRAEAGARCVGGIGAVVVCGVEIETEDHLAELALRASA